MDRGGGRIGGTWTRAWGGKAFAGLAFLALALQLMFPAGFMVAEPGHAHDGVPIVICTVQGQMTVDWDSLTGVHKPKAPAKIMASCPFAGHATASPPPAPQALAQPVAFVRHIEAARPYAVFPGRGLAAPPPPAIGPPAQA